MENLYISSDPRYFFVYLDKNNFTVRHNARLLGKLFSTPVLPEKDNLMFLPNLEFGGFISTFQFNLLRRYHAEYNLEIARRKYFNDYNSRMNALFLFENEEDAKKYYHANLDHVGDRQFTKVKTEGKYFYSKHDSTFIDFFIKRHAIDQSTWDFLAKMYWQGEESKNYQLSSGDQGRGEKYEREPLYEILYTGNVSVVG